VSKTIILMRHGQPRMATTENISMLEMKNWIEQYNRSEIIRNPAPDASQQLAAAATTVVSSSAPRALTSIEVLGLKPAVVDALFCETQLPHGGWRFPRLAPFTWAFIFRILWLCGYSSGVESFCAAKQRASATAQRLQSLAGDRPVLLLDHGVMNRMIARRLQASGWTCQQRSGSRYWSASVYHYAGV